MFALLLCAVVWWVGPLIAIGIYRPLFGFWVRAIIITLILCWALWPFVASFLAWVFRHVRAPRAIRKKTAQRDRVTTRFHDALRTLQYVGLAKQRTGWQRFRYRFTREHISEKPWFLVVGPPGSGKTSLIGESGERFLLAEHYGLQQTVDVGPTQDCNLWLAENSVYIDTSGEWIQLNGDGEEAAKARDTLFKLIKRHRRYPGIDGIILCLDARWLLRATMTERKSVADALRVRLLETASTFRSDLAVYFTISHIDQITGGETFLSMLDDELLQKGMGFSLNRAKNAETLFTQYESLYREMVARVSHHVLELLHDAPDAECRQQLLFFTESLGSLGNPLYSLLEQIFPQTPVGYSCHLQQVWLGSAIALPPRDAIYNAQAADMYEDRPTGHIYLPELTYAWQERGVLQHSSKTLLSGNKLAAGGRYVVVFILLAVFLNVLAMRYLWESDYISYIAARFDETKRIVREIPVTNRISDDVISAYEQMGYMNVQLLGEVSPFLNPYIEHKLINNAAKKTYQRHLLQIFWPAVENYIASELKNDVSDSNKDVYSTLKVYVMLGKPEHRSDEALVNWFMARWENLIPQGYTDMNKDVFIYHLREMFSLPNAPVMKMNDDLLRLARVKAMNIPMQARVVRRIEEKPLPAAIWDISLADAAGPNVSLMLRRKSQATVTDTAVSGFYTRASYRDVFLPQLDDASKDMIEEESWVLRESEEGSTKLDSLASAQRLADEARKLYLIEYADKWDVFVRDVRARPVNGLEDAASLARQLSDPSSPLANLVRFVARETSMTGTNQGDAASWFDSQRNHIEQQRRDILGEISGERSRFRLTPERAVEDRFELIRRLGYQLLQTNNNNDPLNRSFEALYNQLSTLSISLRGGQVVPANDMLKRLQLDAARQPEPVRSVMTDLLQVGDTQTVRQSQQNLSKGASSLASGLCNSSISGRYPFVRNARAEVGIDDFSRMFGRGGAMQQFFDDNLASYVDVNAQRWSAKPGAEGLVTKSTLSAFENAALIRNTFFTSGEKLSFSMFVRPLSLTPTITEAILDIDGQVITYSHGFIQPTRVEWPGPKGGSYVRLTFKTGTGQVQVANFDGPWALFRMFDASNPVAIDGDRRELTASMSSVVGVLKLELRSTMKDFPLWSRGLKGFSCPKAI
ncbi:type VI secretion system membrane subunit TssM [Pseudomonas sp. TTU2014-080ASC]|uniref:type VI secretion system membrane subunit TssM n=1 Tax=Pseudomonas sp. TTU2014-080ASC TaxID=1729724 RepID=UPI001F4CD583|nr:type VI secretion system membrane subunit TssM [Pseudomonas sp. TTU2014-080ASC]